MHGRAHAVRYHRAVTIAHPLPDTKRAFSPSTAHVVGFAILGSIFAKSMAEKLAEHDMWWHLSHDTVITSEWATPSMIENGLNPADLLGRKFGHHLNFWSMSGRTLTQRINLGDEHQMVLELRPAHEPFKFLFFCSPS